MRYASIDILRMVALFVMVFVHFAENLSGVTAIYAGLGAPLFAFLSGVSYLLWIRGQERQGRTEAEISKVSIRRGLFIFGVGIVFNILVWLPEDVFNWDVLTFIGVGLVLLCCVRHVPLPAQVAMAVTILLISPFLREIADYSSYWQNPYFDPDWSLTDVLIGFLVTGYFPLFPWLVFPLAGFATARLLFPEPDQDSASISASALAGVGLALLVISLLVVAAGIYLPRVLSQVLLGGWTMYPPATAYVVGMLGANLTLLGLTHQGIDRNEHRSRSRWLRIPKRFSQYSFTIYVVHHLVHVWPLWIWATLQGQETTYYWMNALPLWTSLLLAGLFLIVTCIVLQVVGENRNYGIESGMRWLCD